MTITAWMRLCTGWYTHCIVSAMQTILPVVCVLITFGTIHIASYTRCSDEGWMKTSSANFSHLLLWKEIANTDSANDCVTKCYNSYCSGIGYQTSLKKCFLYLDWNTSAPWSPVSTVDYYVSASAGLPKGWHDMRRYGTLFAMQIPTVRHTWSEANTYCIDKGGMLLNIHTYARKQAIADAFAHQGITVGWYWVGASDQEVEGQWYWGNGSPGLSPNFFAADEPNDYGGEDCAVVFSLPDILLADISCLSYMKFICEFPLVL